MKGGEGFAHFWGFVKGIPLADHPRHNSQSVCYETSTLLNSLRGVDILKPNIQCVIDLDLER